MPNHPSRRRRERNRRLGDADVETVGAAGASEAGTETAAAGTGTAAERGEYVTPSEDNEGKTVVDAHGETIGMVVEVEADTIYVDPDPSLTDRIKAVLDWGEMEEDAYPVDVDRIVNITDDQVELSIRE